MKGLQEEVSGCKESVKKMLQWMNVNLSNLNEWHKEKSYLKNEIDNLKGNDERVKEIEKLKRHK